MSGPLFAVDDECPNCQNGTLGFEEGRLVCRGECGTFFDNEDEDEDEDEDDEGDERYPVVIAISNVRRVRSQKHSEGYSFIFEAQVKLSKTGEPENHSYGPDVNGNWTCRSDCPDRLPNTNTLFPDTRTVPIGWYWLNERYSQLPLLNELARVVQ
jgi:hypothetical protein